MKVRPAEITDLPAVEAILKASDLLFEDCYIHIDSFLVAVAGDKIVGTGGLEHCGDVALLRSIAVVEDCRGQGIGDTLYFQLKSRAQSHGAKALYLLTETAEQYFEARDFSVVKRNAVPTAIGETQQFSNLCPASATAMKIVL